MASSHVAVGHIGGGVASPSRPRLNVNTRWPSLILYMDLDLPSWILWHTLSLAPWPQVGGHLPLTLLITVNLKVYLRVLGVISVGWMAWIA